jgi:hypothetical protein
MSRELSTTKPTEALDESVDMAFALLLAIEAEDA